MAITVRQSAAIKTALVAAVVVFFVAVGGFMMFGTRDHAQDLITHVDSYGAWSRLVFCAIVVAEIVLLLPGILFTLSAGFLFGPFWGSVLILIGTSIGAAISYSIGRYLMGERMATYLLGNPRLYLVNENLRDEGWRFIMCTRMVPFFPFKLSNYAFGVIRFPFIPFVTGSAIGNVPITVMNVYIGSLAADITAVGARTAPRSPEEWTMYGAGLLVAVAAVWGLARMGRRALQPYMKDDAGQSPAA